MHKMLAVLLIVVLATQSTSAATIYLRDKTRIEHARIVQELPSVFHITKEGGTYSSVYEHDTIDKRDVFCIIDDAGALRYPKTLAETAGIASGAIDSLTAEEFQMALLRQQVEAQKEQAENLRGLGTVAFISAFAAVSSSIALWFLYGQTK